MTSIRELKLKLKHPVTVQGTPPPAHVPAHIADMSVRDAALAYAEAGLFVVPVRAGSKSPGSLVGAEWTKQSSRDAKTIKEWFTRWPTANVGIHAGKSGLLVFDLDKADDLEQLPADIAGDLRLGTFQRSRTGARGHYVFADTLGYGNAAGGFAPWGEVRGRNGFIMAAPSIHPDTGESYRWADDCGEIVETPASLRALIGSTALEAAEPLTPNDLNAFLAQHATETAPARLDSMVRAFRERSENEARHTAMQGILVGSFRDARHGLYSARRAFDTLAKAYTEAFQTAGSRCPPPGEFGAMAQWAAAQPEPAEVAARLWDMSPVLKSVLEAAHKWGVSPWALLGEGLLRALLAVPPSWYLPDVVGSPAPLNLFVSLVGRSGAGKGAAGGLADRVFQFGDSDTVADLNAQKPGSGEGIPTLFGRYDAKTKHVHHLHTRAHARFNEIDQLTGMESRQGSTLSALLRECWSGEKMGTSTNDASRTNRLETGRYRYVMTVGVQPERAGWLLDGESGGLPQRFLWMSATDPDQPMPSAASGDTPPVVKLPRWDFDRLAWLSQMGMPVPEEAWQQTFSIPDAVRQQIREARQAGMQGRTNAMDGHRLLLMEKAALGFAVMHDKTHGFDLEHWQMAERLMLHSDATLTSIRSTLGEANRRRADSRAASEGRGEVIRSDAAEAELRSRCRERIVTILSAGDDWIAGADLRRKLSTPQKQVCEDVLQELLDDGTLMKKRVGTVSKGSRYRIRNDQ